MPDMDVQHLHPIPRSVVMSNLFASLTFRVLFAVSVLVGLVLVPITYWAFDNQHPYVFDAEHSVIIPSEAVGNDQMIVSWQVTINRQCPGMIHRELFDPRTKVVLAIYDAQPAYKSEELKPGPGRLNRTFLLPRKMQTGQTGYRAKMEYWCNPLQRIWPIRYITPELLFEVKE